MCNHIFNSHPLGSQKLHRQLIIAWTISKAPLQHRLFVTNLTDGEADSRRTQTSLYKGAASFEAMDPALDARLDPRGINNNIGTLAQLRSCAQLLRVRLGTLRWHPKCIRGTGAPRKGQAILRNIDSHHARGAKRPGNSAAEQPDRPGAKHGKAFALGVPGKTAAVHRDTQRLDERPFAERDLTREQMAAFLWEDVVGREGPVVWRRRGESYIRAEVVAATSALLAGVAGSARLKSYPVAGS